MSVTNWALSGNPLTEAVVSTKTGHVFERSIIEKHIQETGQWPITGINLELKDLLPLKGKILYFSFISLWINTLLSFIIWEIFITVLIKAI